MMKSSFLTLSCCLSLACGGLVVLPCQAQETPTDTMSTSADVNANAGYQKNETSTTYGNNDNWNPLNLIHNMRMANKDPEQFRQNSDASIDDAAADYRNQLLQYWQQQQRPSVTPVTPTPTPNNTTPTTQP